MAKIHLGVRLDEARVLLVLLPLERLRQAAEVVPRRRGHAVIVDDRLLVAHDQPVVGDGKQTVGEGHLVDLLVLDVAAQSEDNDELIKVDRLIALLRLGGVAPLAHELGGGEGTLCVEPAEVGVACGEDVTLDLRRRSDRDLLGHPTGVKLVLQHVHRHQPSEG